MKPLQLHLSACLDFKKAILLKDKNSKGQYDMEVCRILATYEKEGYPLKMGWQFLLPKRIKRKIPYSDQLFYLLRFNMV